MTGSSPVFYPEKDDKVEKTQINKALFIWGGLAHLGGMFLSFRSYDIFYPT